MNRRFLFGAALAALVIAGATLTLSTEQTSSNTITTPQPAPGTAAMRAYIDPETGAIEVGARTAAPSATSPALDRETENALRRDDTGLVQIHHADGSVSVDLEGRFQSVSVLRMTDDGPVIECTDNADEANRVLQGQTTPEVK